MIELLKTAVMVPYYGVLRLSESELISATLFLAALIIIAMVYEWLLKFKYLNEKKTFCIVFTLSFFILAILKFAIWINLKADTTYSAYLATLKHHTLDALKYFVVKPPLTDWFNAFWMSFFDLGFVSSYHPFVLINMALNLVSFALVVKTCSLLRLNKVIYFTLAFLLGTFFIPYEAHAGGYSYDHLVFFCNSYFLYSLVNYGVGNDFKKTNLSISLLLVILQSSIYLLLAPILTIMVFFFDSLRGQSLKEYFKQWFWVAFAPFFVVIILFSKNFYYTGLIGTSSIGGPTLMLVVQKMFNKDKSLLRKELVASKAKEWYLWCYDNFKVPIDPVTLIEYSDWDRNALAFGICTAMGKAGTESYPLDFKSLSKDLKENEFFEIAKIVDKDLSLRKKIPHIGNTMLPEASSLWTVAHSKESLQLAKKIFWKHPDKLASTFLKLQGLFMKEGPNYVERENLRKLKPSIIKKILSRLIVLMERLLKVFYPLSFIFFIISFLGLFIWKDKIKLFGYVVITAPIFMSTYIFNIFSGEENHRYFLQVIPYVTIFIAIFITNLFETSFRCFLLKGKHLFEEVVKR